MHRLSDSVKATIRPAEWAISAAFSIACRGRSGPQRYPSRNVTEAARIMSSSSTSAVSSWLAPGDVFIVRWASGVTRIRQRPVGGGLVIRLVSKCTPSECMS